MNIFDLSAKLTLDDSDFTSGVKKASKSAKVMGGDVEHASKRIDKSMQAVSARAIAMGHAMYDAAKTAGRALVSLAKTGLRYNSDMENYTTNFKVMLGSTEAAAKKVEEIKKMAEKTPFGMSDLADATQTLLAFQVPAENSTDILKMLGDVALGDKEKLKGLALVFGQVSSAGKLQGQDLMQLINQGFNPLNYIAQRTGESMEDLRKRMSEGKISAEEVTQAFKDATSEGGQFYNGMEEASKTMDGLKSTLEDVVKSKLGEFFKGISDKIKELLPKIIEFVQNIDVGEVKEKLKDLYQTFKKLSPIIVYATAATVAYKAAISISKLIDLLRNATLRQAAAQKFLNAVVGANKFVILASVIVGVVAAIATLWKTNEGFRNAVKKIWSDIKTSFKMAWDAIKDTFKDVGKFFSKVWGSIKNGLSDAWEGTKESFKMAWEAIKEIFSGIGNFFSNAWQGVKKGVPEVWANTKESFRMAWQAIKDTFSDVGAFFGRVWNSITEKFAHVSDWFREKFSNAWEAVKNVFSTGGKIFDGIKDGIAEVFRTIVNKIIGGINRTIAIPFNAINRILDRIRNTSILGITPFKWVHTFEVPQIPQLYDGGILKRGQIGLLEGRGDEAVVPLHNNKKWISKVADDLRQSMNGFNTGGGVNVVQNIYSEAKTAADLMQEAIYQQEKAVLLGV